MIRGGQIFEASVNTGQTTFCLKIFQGDTGRATFWTLILYGAHNFLCQNILRRYGVVTFWTLILYGADNFFHSKFSVMIRGGQLFAPSFYTGRRSFLSQNLLRWYGAGNFLIPHFIRGRQLLYTGRTTFWILILYGAKNFFSTEKSNFPAPYSHNYWTLP